MRCSDRIIRVDAWVFLTPVTAAPMSLECRMCPSTFGHRQKYTHVTQKRISRRTNRESGMQQRNKRGKGQSPTEPYRLRVGRRHATHAQPSQGPLARAVTQAHQQHRRPKGQRVASALGSQPSHASFKITPARLASRPTFPRSFRFTRGSHLG